MGYSKIKIAMIGAGSVSFCPATLCDIVKSELLNSLPLEVVLMDIDAKALQMSYQYGQRLVSKSKRLFNLSATTNLEQALEGCDFVITAIERSRYFYWSQDFHVPRKYGFRQIYGENGGPGGMFHYLRNIVPLLEISHGMERMCPDAFLINYTNPEAKIVETVLKLSKIRAVGVCHGYVEGVKQVARILERDPEELVTAAHGFNHFGFFTKVHDRETGEDLYPLLRLKEKECHWLSDWDELGLSRIMLRTFGLWPYPGANHIGEYLGWSDSYLASSKIQYFYDPVVDRPWKTGSVPSFVYNLSSNPTGIPLDHKDEEYVTRYENSFASKGDADAVSGESGIPIIEAIVFDLAREIPSLNVLNQSTMPGILQNMCVEGPCRVDSNGIHLLETVALPTGVQAMINLQGAVHRLLIEALVENSRNKLLQALLIDPTVATYNNAVALIDEMFELQKDVLPPLVWN